MKKLLLSILLIPFLLVGCNKKNKSGGEEQTPEVHYIDVSVTEVSLVEGETYQIPINILNKTIIICQSSNEQVATVSHEGLVTAIAQGESTITISGGKDRFTVFVTVSLDEAKDSLQIVMPKTSYNIALGDEYIIPLSVKYGNQIVSNPTLHYTYEVEGIVSIEGLNVTTLSVGTTKCVVEASYNEMSITSSFTISVY